MEKITIKKLKNNLIKLSKFSKKVLVLFTVLCVSLSTIGFGNIMTILAENEDQQVELIGGTKDGDYIEYYDGETLMGTVLTKIYGEIKTPSGNKITLPEYSDPYQVMFYITLENGYDTEDVYVNGVYAGLVSGDMDYGMSITSDSDMTVTFNFKASSNGPEGPGGPGDEGPLPSMVNYPLLAYFEGITDPVESNIQNNTITIPNNWTAGTVSFKAKVCEVDGNLSPDDGICAGGTQSTSDLKITAFILVEELRGIVTGSEDNSHLNIGEGFDNVGKAGIHLGNSILNLTTDLISENLINVLAEAPMQMSYSYGTSTIDQAIVTNFDSGNVSIFFGNTEATLFATGPNVVGITNLTGAEHILNAEEKSVTISLPPLSEETTTTVSIEIELSDNTTVTRQINIIRTAIELEFDGENRTLNAGYVMHKAYLYNNQPHNSEIFDAYLQVVLYRDDVVVGYKQIQIDDEEFVNNLGEDESGSIESVGPGRILLFSGEIKGVNKANVFLTNGPIDYNSDTLPSVEFGIGAGVQIEWGE